MAYIFIPALGVPIFIWITILSYASASLHVPHSLPGVAMGLIGTFRAAGGAVGNSIHNVILNDRFSQYSGPLIAKAAIQHNLNLEQLPEIIPAAIEYSLGVPHAFAALPNITPAVQDALRTAVCDAYAHAYKIVFLVTLAFSVTGIICGLFVEDPTIYMTNHVQFAMPHGSDGGDIEGKALPPQDEKDGLSTEQSVARAAETDSHIVMG